MTQESQQALDRVLDKLERIRASITTHIQPDGRLDEGDQYAVRVIESRKRFLHRLADVKDKLDGVEILRLRDVGELFLIGDKKHSKGNVDCRGCDLVEKADPADNLLTISVPGGRLCSHCQRGVEHLQTLRKEINGVGLPGVPVPTPTLVKMQPETRHTPSNRTYRCVQAYVCDNCGASIVLHDYTETEQPKKERWIGVRL